jgi:hypothetical protein
LFKLKFLQYFQHKVTVVNIVLIFYNLFLPGCRREEDIKRAVDGARRGKRGEVGEGQWRMERGSHGLPNVSPRLAMPNPSTPCGQATCGHLLPPWTPHVVRLWGEGGGSVSSGVKGRKGREWEREGKHLVTSPTWQDLVRRRDTVIQNWIILGLIQSKKIQSIVISQQVMTPCGCHYWSCRQAGPGIAAHTVGHDEALKIVSKSNPIFKQISNHCA